MDARHLGCDLPGVFERLKGTVPVSSAIGKTGTRDRMEAARAARSNGWL